MAKQVKDKKKLEKTNVEVDFEPKLDLDSLDDDNDHEIKKIVKENLDLFDQDIIEHYLGEILSVSQRMKKKQQVRRYKARMQIARKRMMKRRATTGRLTNRARRSAIYGVKKRLAGGRTPGSLNYSERARIERLAKRRKNVIKRNTRRLLIKKRAQERKRLSGGR